MAFNKRSLPNGRVSIEIIDPNELTQQDINNIIASNPIELYYEHHHLGRYIPDFVNIISNSKLDKIIYNNIYDSTRCVLLASIIVRNNISVVHVSNNLFRVEEDEFAKSTRIIEIHRHPNIDLTINNALLSQIISNNKLRRICLAILCCKSNTANIYNITSYRDLLHMIARMVWWLGFLLYEKC